MSIPPARPTIAAGGAEAVIDPAAGGRLAALRIDGIDVIKPSGVGPIAWGLYPMAPWAGRLRDGILEWRGERHRLPADITPPHAIHGTLIEVAWDVGALDDTSVELRAPLRPPWPWAGTVTHRFAIEPGALNASLTVEADGQEFPAIVGWHPWFLRSLRDAAGRAVGEAVELDFGPGGMLERGADYLPTGTIVRPVPAGPWDDCFVDVLEPPRLRWPGALEVTVESDVPCWVCYTHPPDAVCVEPQTGPPNGLNTGEAFVVGPERPLIASMTLRWRRLPP